MGRFYYWMEDTFGRAGSHYCPSSTSQQIECPDINNRNEIFTPHNYRRLFSSFIALFDVPFRFLFVSFPPLSSDVFEWDIAMGEKRLSVVGWWCCDLNLPSMFPSIPSQDTVATTKYQVLCVIHFSSRLHYNDELSWAWSESESPFTRRFTETRWSGKLLKTSKSVEGK